LTIADAGLAWRPPAVRDRIIRWLDNTLIYGSVFFVPYDLPLIHEAGILLLGLAVLLFVVRRDGQEFLAFARKLAWVSWPSLVLAGIALCGVYANFGTILHSEFQGQAGWSRAVYQAILFLVTLAFPLYLAFCLSRHDDWLSMLIRAAWWSLPIPIFVALLQIANVAGLHAVAHLPYVGDAYEGGSYRISGTAREASWFGGYLCLTAVLSLMDLRRATRQRHKVLCICTVALLVVILFLGFSKSPYVAALAAFGTALMVFIAVRRPWRGIAIIAFGLLAVVIVIFLGMVFLPSLINRVIEPGVARGEAMYALFEPLLLGTTSYTSVGTRFGMSSAAISMAVAHPGLGVGLGQFGYHVYSYFPLWGLNGETSEWLSNDAKAWPSPTNFYLRILCEAGFPATTIYLLLRVAIVAVIVVRVLRSDCPTWWRDVGVLSLLASQVVLDFNRDTFVNLNQWTVIAMALACIMETGRSAGVARISRPRHPVLLPLAAVLFVFPVLAIAAKPVTYTASATLVPKSSDISITPSQQTDVEISGQTKLESLVVQVDQLGLFRKYWASREAAARLIADRPDLVRTAMGTNEISPQALSAYLNDNVTVLLADKQSTVTLVYDNVDARVASQFLSLAIRQTDRAVANSVEQSGNLARQMFHLAERSDIDQESRRILINRSVAKELQSAFENAGENSSFDYVERPGPAGAVWFQPISVFMLSLLLAFMTVTLLLVVRTLANSQYFTSRA